MSRARGAAALLLALALSACGGPAGPGGPSDPVTTTYLLLDNAGQGSVSVMSTAGPLAELAVVGNVELGDDVRPCGMAIGPSGRLYVTDFDGARVLVIDLDAVLDGSATGSARLATISVPGLVEPCGMAFDGSGHMWIADRRGSMLPDAFVANHLLQFDASAVAAATGTLELSPVRALEPVHDGGTDADDVLETRWIRWLGFDPEGRLWYTDTWNRSVNRIDAPGDHALGLSTGVEPDMQLAYAHPNLNLLNVASLAFDGDGNVYVGTIGNAQAHRFEVSRLPSDGRLSVEPDATLVFPLPDTTIVGPSALTIDAEGALWAGATNRALFRLTLPGTRDGAVTPAVTATWTSVGNTDGATFVWTSRTTP